MAILRTCLEIPTWADGTTTSAGTLIISSQVSNGCFHLQTIKDGNIVPISGLTAGTATIEISEDGFNWGSIENGTITFGAAYDRPIVLGCQVRHVRVTLAGTVGSEADSARLCVTNF